MCAILFYGLPRLWLCEAFGSSPHRNPHIQEWQSFLNLLSAAVEKSSWARMGPTVARSEPMMFFRDLNPKPTAWWDHRCEELATANAKEVIPYVADGGEEQLFLDFSESVPIYLDTSHLTNKDMEVVMSIRQRFKLTRCAEYLFRVDLKASKSSTCSTPNR